MLDPRAQVRGRNMMVGFIKTSESAREPQFSRTKIWIPAPWFGCLGYCKNFNTLSIANVYTVLYSMLSRTHLVGSVQLVALLIINERT
jgi:hypothetical protein